MQPGVIAAWVSSGRASIHQTNASAPVPWTMLVLSYAIQGRQARAEGSSCVRASSPIPIAGPLGNRSPGINRKVLYFDDSVLAVQSFARPHGAAQRQQI